MIWPNIDKYAETITPIWSSDDYFLSSICYFMILYSSSLSISIFCLFYYIKLGWRRLLVLLEPPIRSAKSSIIFYFFMVLAFWFMGGSFFLFIPLLLIYLNLTENTKSFLASATKVCGKNSSILSLLILPCKSSKSIYASLCCCAVSSDLRFLFNILL